MSSPQPSVAQRFGEHLRTVRVAAGVTQDGVAQLMTDRGFKWMQTTVTKTESAARPLLLDEFVALCEVLDMDPTLTLAISRGPEIKREVRLAELRAQIASKRREMEKARDLVMWHAHEEHELVEKLERLEADE